MNSLTNLQIKVLEESGTLCGVDTHQDVKTLLDRVNNEGISFLTITLPSFSKDLQRALDQGEVASNLFVGLKRPRNSCLPEFLQGFMKLIFDASTGRLRHDWSPGSAIDLSAVDAVRCLFQFTGFAAKVLLPCTVQRVDAAFDRYMTNEAHVREFDILRSSSLMREFRIASSWLFDDVFSRVSSDIRNNRIIGSHGPGSTNDRLFGNEKWSNRSWPDQLEAIFSFGEYGCANWRDYLERSQSGSAVPGTPNPVKVIGVPKTLKTPRIIAVEQTAVMFMQQGLRRSIEDGIRDSKFANAVISYQSQIPNQDLARIGSSLGELATLDLSDASDLVSNQLVRTLLAGHPHLLDAVDATRTREADVPNHGVVRLAKFASMGSALCFPFEAMVFCTIIFVQMHRAYPTVAWKELKNSFLGRVRVYGDDIVVPKEHAQSVSDLLEAFGLKVNRTKSFWTGMYRESCGKEYFAGSDVTIARIREMLPTKQMSSNERVVSIVRTVALRNNLFLKGYYSTCEYLDEILLGYLNGIFPFVGPDSPALGRLTNGPISIDSWDNVLQRPLVKAYTVHSVSPDSPVDHWPALLKVLLDRSELPNPDLEHLLKAGRSLQLRIKVGRCSPF